LRSQRIGPGSRKVPFAVSDGQSSWPRRAAHENLPGSGRSEPPSTDQRRRLSEKHQRLDLVHGLSSRPAFFVSRGKWNHVTYVGCSRNPVFAPEERMSSSSAEMRATLRAQTQLCLPPPHPDAEESVQRSASTSPGPPLRRIPAPASDSVRQSLRRVDR